MKKITMKCPVCRGCFKHTKKPYILKTRDARRKEINIENLPMLECTICDYEEISPQGESLIKDVKDMVKIGMEELAKKEELILHKQQEKSLVTVLRKIIG